MQQNRERGWWLLAVCCLPVAAMAEALPVLDPFAVSGSLQLDLAGSVGLPALDEQDTILTLEQGTAHVMRVPGLERVAVANGRVVSALAQDNEDVVIFANQRGTTSVLVWSAASGLKRVRVQVVAADTPVQESELRSLLAQVPQTRVKRVGEHLLIEGRGLSEEDRRRVDALSKRYPQLIDFTGQVGWERMVRFDVMVMEVPRHRLRDIGLRWQGVSDGGIQAGAGWTAAQRGRPDGLAESLDLTMSAPASASLASPVAWLGVHGVLSARLHALVQSGTASLLATPQLTARSGSTARFMAGGELPYMTVDKNGNPNTVFKPYGVGLEIKPRVDPDGRVHAVIDVEVSQVDASVSGSAGPGLTMRRTTTEFNMQAGETLVLSGFLSKETASETTGVPGLSALPLVGALFRQTRSEERETELVVVVTPALLDIDSPRLDQQRAVVRARREAQPASRWLDHTLFPKEDDE